MNEDSCALRLNFRGLVPSAFIFCVVGATVARFHLQTAPPRTSSLSRLYVQRHVPGVLISIIKTAKTYVCPQTHRNLIFHRRALPFALLSRLGDTVTPCPSPRKCTRPALGILITILTATQMYVLGPRSTQASGLTPVEIQLSIIVHGPPSISLHTGTI